MDFIYTYLKEAGWGMYPVVKETPIRYYIKTNSQKKNKSKEITRIVKKEDDDRAIINISAEDINDAYNKLTSAINEYLKNFAKKYNETLLNNLPECGIFSLSLNNGISFNYKPEHQKLVNNLYNIHMAIKSISDENDKEFRNEADMYKDAYNAILKTNKFFSIEGVPNSFNNKIILSKVNPFDEVLIFDNYIACSVEEDDRKRKILFKQTDLIEPITYLINDISIVSVDKKGFKTILEYYKPKPVDIFDYISSISIGFNRDYLYYGSIIIKPISSDLIRTLLTVALYLDRHRISLNKPEYINLENSEIAAILIMYKDILDKNKNFIRFNIDSEYNYINKDIAMDISINATRYGAPRISINGNTIYPLYYRYFSKDALEIVVKIYKDALKSYDKEMAISWELKNNLKDL